MKNQEMNILGGTLHEISEDLEKFLLNNPNVLEIWNDLTPLARNEWICWIITVKKPQTRKSHIQRLKESLLGGKRRPCCWAGCLHRKMNENKLESPTE
jgi:uncharacterized protein YdeI (YjbR/CyaY-like superfamily)